jgi:hypothetical protein
MSKTQARSQKNEKLLPGSRHGCFASQRLWAAITAKEMSPMTKTMKTLLLASALAIGATAAFAQHSYRSMPYAVSNDGPNGEGRNTGYGQGGSAGTHPTGANVGPGRAAMDHATGY